MSEYIINGSRPLSGKIRCSGNKNSILKLIPACILTNETVKLENVPSISDVRVMIRIMQKLGANVRYFEKGKKLEINCSKVNSFEIPEEEATKLRASNMFLGPLLARFGKVVGVIPGGDKIGPREMTAHFSGLDSLGAKLVKKEKNKFFLEGKLIGGEVFLYEPSVTATENVILASVLAAGSTKIINAACEPHTRDLCEFLNKIGAKISGIGSNVLYIEGVKKLTGGSHTVINDHLDAGALIIMSAVTNGEIEIQDINVSDMKTILWFFEQLGVRVEVAKNSIFVPKNQKLVVKDKEWASIKGVYSQPWYCFPTDLLSLTVVLGTQVKGSILFFEKMYPGRMFFAQYLNGMGANIIMCDPHRIVVNGPTKLKGTTLFCPDIRAGMAFLIAALAAEGRSILKNGEHIERGYENICERLQSIGADIERVE